MQYKKDDYLISDVREEIQLDQVKSLLRSSYWASKRDLETIKTSIINSECFSLFYQDHQIGFARVVTDFATVAYIADLIIHPDHRSQGLGIWLTDTIVNDPRWCAKFKFLVTDDAHSLYEKFGFSGSPKLLSTQV
ncbi:GNAT family N-acetyltransferase [Pseudoalteromonas luteoviolacea]|uniref:GNAT family N-acetyltransferase n=1 Tax=Pseudoalteromonas luteoviolacea TaxID=43657 RepID=UPI001F3B337A|nr:GNAT family N-acetyltransferase [Pseudoalteromonas luteoviolacea]MCF6441249.1 GNAT family N-acetyltransferase [Pseudoalteromonas luteoviolacea]